MSKRTEVLIIHETVAQSAVKDIVSLGVLSAGIALGVYLDSAALQWTAGVIWMVVLATATGHLGERMTIARARKRLDEIEASFTGAPPSHDNLKGTN